MAVLVMGVSGCQCPGDSLHVARMYITGVLLLGSPVAVLAMCTVPGGCCNVASSGCTSTGDLAMCKLIVIHHKTDISMSGVGELFLHHRWPGLSSSHIVQLQPLYVLLIFTYIHGTQYSIPFLIPSFHTTPPQCLTTTEV